MASYNTDHHIPSAHYASGSGDGKCPICASCIRAACNQLSIQAITQIHFYSCCCHTMYDSDTVKTRYASHPHQRLSSRLSTSQFINKRLNIKSETGRTRQAKWKHEGGKKQKSLCRPCCRHWPPPLLSHVMLQQILTACKDRS